MPARDFLNVERLLEERDRRHAIRELIANALDRAALTDAAEPRIENGCRVTARKLNRPHSNAGPERQQRDRSGREPVAC